MTRVAHIMMISSRTSNWDCISSRRSSITIQGWQSQLILSGTHNLLLQFWRILELKASLWRGLMSIFFSRIKQSSFGGLSLPMGKSTEHFPRISDGQFTASRINLSVEILARTCA